MGYRARGTGTSGSPTGYQLDHTCVNSLCVNVRHLQETTAEENRYLQMLRSQEYRAMAEEHFSGRHDSLPGEVQPSETSGESDVSDVSTLPMLDVANPRQYVETSDSDVSPTSLFTRRRVCYPWSTTVLMTDPTSPTSPPPSPVDRASMNIIDLCSETSETSETSGRSGFPDSEPDRLNVRIPGP